MNIKNTLTVLLLCSGAMFTNAANAGYAHHGKHFLLTERAANKLSLTEAQQEQIAAILDEKRTAIKAAKKAGTNKKDAFKHIIESESFDEDQARDTIAQIQAVKAQVWLAKLKSKQQIWLVLDTEQREKFASIKRKKMKKHY